MEANASENAYPQTVNEGDGVIGYGLTKREYFAGQALTQFLALQGEKWSGKDIPRHICDQFGKNAVAVAEGLLRALK